MRGTMITTTLSLQAEIWLQIISWLPFEQLLALTLVSRRLRDLCCATLSQERERLRATYTSIPSPNQKDQPFLLHSVLFKILLGEVPASCILELICDEDCVEDPDYEHTRHRDRLPSLRNVAAKSRVLIQTAVEHSRAIPPDEVEHYTTAICAGSEDAALALLLPMLTNLRHLRPPMNAPRLEATTARIAASSSLTTTSPLHNLVLISTNAGNGDEYGMALDHLTPYAALPSVRRIVVRHGRSYNDDDFAGWPTSLPFSRASQVFFSESSILPSVVRKFGEGFSGPCVMRQWWKGHGSQMPSGGRDVEWDFLRVEGGERDFDTGRHGEGGEGIVAWKQGSRKETMELRYEDVHDDAGMYSAAPLSDPSYESEMNDLLDGRVLEWKNL